MVTNGLPYLDLQQSRSWSSSLQCSDLHQKAWRQCSEQLQQIPLRSCNNHRRLILAASPLPCSLISCDRAHIHRNIKTAVFRARKRKNKTLPTLERYLSGRVKIVLKAKKFTLKHIWRVGKLLNHGQRQS